ncbi:MAG: metallopeptidase family protein [Gemmatimonadales bacterium]|nr:metallopeptidase family protein [Gemmatimonadales bacterium]
MTRDAFEAMVRAMAREVPPEFLDGVTEVVVSPRTVPHPTREGIFTLGEAVPVPVDVPGAEAGGLCTRVILYHGSFRALATLDDAFDWREEAWETLTHELRHHIEWRAGDPRLEAFDRAAEQNFARQDGEPFDPLFFLDGDAPVEGVWEVEHDYFIDHVVATVPAEVRFTWHGRPYAVAVPAGTRLPAFLTVDGVDQPPPGELVLVLRHRPRLTDLFRAAPVPDQRSVTARRC